MTPIPPSRAIAIAIADSVTVSIAADTIGAFKRIFWVKRVVTLTALGTTSEYEGINNTSSKVKPSNSTLSETNDIPEILCSAKFVLNYKFLTELETFRKILFQYWGYTGFRSLQEEIIRSVMQNKDTLALMPTGGGKSITFQVPALAREGICLVITPLISLMQDQVENLKARNIRAVAIHSGLTKFELDIALDNCIYGEYKFLYLSPERLSTDLFLKRLESMKVSLIAVDEAHCISQWGYDFRPSYLQVASIRQYLPGIPVLALTATATPTVADDIQEKLLFREKNTIRQTFERKNLVYLVRKTDDKYSYLLRILNKQNGCGIIYVRNRKKTREIAEYLTKQGISSQFYHAGLDQKDRKVRQEGWTRGKVRIMVATNAFGMGIDKPDVRVVVHMDLPDSPEAYFQEAGRAGRDGKKAFAVLLYQDADKLSIQKSHTVRFPDIDLIRRVYQALGNYFEVVPGSGKNQVFDFDLMDFCAKFSFHSLVAFHALKHLERSGYLELTDDIDLPARVHFRVDRDELYKFQVVNEGFDGVIKLLLRVYSGMFSDFVRIDEYNLAGKAKVPVQTIINVLSTLKNMGILYYIKPKKTPQIIFTAERLPEKSLLFPKKEYEEQESLTRMRMDTMIHYATETHRCRSQMLLMYFGEKDPFRCGQCDVCMESEDRPLNRYDHDLISGQIREITRSGPVTLPELNTRILAEPVNISRVLDDLFEQKWLVWSDGFLKWMGEEE
jgi:ATP-dependent DNA helicase RecQ